MATIRKGNPATAMRKTMHPSAPPSLVYANSHGEISDFPELAMAGRSGGFIFQPALEDLIPLPEGSELFVLPGRLPVGTNRATAEPLKLSENPVDSSEGLQAVAAFMAPAYTSIHTAAFEKVPGAPVLPLFAYTSVGWRDGRFWVAGFRSDADPRQDASGFDCGKIRRMTDSRLKAYPGNRLIQHLGICSLTYSCPAAKNYFLDRFEAPLPTSPVCNAHCLGCISLQPSGCCPSTQERIKFVPTPAEIAEVAISHLERVKNGVVSFGQGCEGEPLLQGRTLEKAIRLIRENTARGTINLNTNASLPAVVDRLAAAGLDSMRVSLNSARPGCYARYYRPQGFGFGNVLASIDLMKQADRFVSLNYLMLPGFTDDPEEFSALSRLIENHRPDLIQLRNLNMDPDWYLEALAHRPAAKPMGIVTWMKNLRKRFPRLRFGYFNPPLR